MTFRVRLFPRRAGQLSVKASTNCPDAQLIHKSGRRQIAFKIPARVRYRVNILLTPRVFPGNVIDAARRTVFLCKLTSVSGRVGFSAKFPENFEAGSNVFRSDVNSFRDRRFGTEMYNGKYNYPLQLRSPFPTIRHRDRMIHSEQTFTRNSRIPCAIPRQSD